MTTRNGTAWVLVTFLSIAGTPGSLQAQPAGGRTADDIVGAARAQTQGASNSAWDAAERRRSDDILVPSRKTTAAVTSTAEPASTGGSPSVEAFNPLDALTGGKVTTTASTASSGAESPPPAATGSQALPQKGATCCGNINWTVLVNFQPTRAPKAKRDGDRPVKKGPKGDDGERQRANKNDKGDDSLQQKIVEKANDVVGKPFSYAAGTDGGRLGCAQVVTTILKRAGVLSNIRLGVLDSVSDLRRQGWKEVKPPPYKDGDVITWATYDRSGDGRVDPDTHIGIIDVRGGTPYAINNSSSQRRPVKVELSAYHYPVTRVLRKA